MSGHSKWSTIKHKKAARDHARGNVFTKMASAITVAVKKGGSPDPESNFSLRLAVDRAKAVNMPWVNIERAIVKGMGQSGGQALEELLMEGYGPGGIGVLIETVTDKHNRTVAEIKNILETAGGRLGEPGSVMYQFDKVGWIIIGGILNEEQTLAAIDLGVVDVQINNGQTRLIVKPEQIQATMNHVREWGYAVLETELGYQPKTKIQRSESESLDELVEELSSHDDVQEVYTT